MTGRPPGRVDGLPPPWALKSVIYRGHRHHRPPVPVDGQRSSSATCASPTDGRDGPGHRRRAERAQPAGRQHRRARSFRATRLFWMRTSRRMRVAYTDREGRFTMRGASGRRVPGGGLAAVDESDLRPPRAAARAGSRWRRRSARPTRRRATMTALHRVAAREPATRSLIDVRRIQSTSASPPTTSTAAAAWIAASTPARIVEVLRDIDADVIALQEVIGAGPAGAGQAEEIGAALGMGWVMNCVRTLRQHQFGNVVLSRLPDRAPQPVRPVVAHVRVAQLPARRPRTSTARSLHIYNVHLGHRRPRAALPGQAARLVRPRSPRHRPEDHPRRLQRVDEGAGDQDAVVALRERRHLTAPQAPPHLPGPLPRRPSRSTSITRARWR